MFNKKESKVEANFDKFDTLIGDNTILEGNLTAKGSIRLDGEVKGIINIEGHLLVGEKASVIGDINTNSLIVSGMVKGNIKAESFVRITANGKVIGDISSKTLVIDEDAFFEGNCKMQALNPVTE